MTASTVMALLACLAGHPDRCSTYHLLTDAPLEACQVAARQWLAERLYLVPVFLSCRDQEPA